MTKKKLCGRLRTVEEALQTARAFIESLDADHQKK
jgi:hypothetical protein